MEANQTAGNPALERDAELEAVRRELRVLQERFRSIIQRTADGILVVGRDGVIRFANQIAGRLFGLEVDQLVGTHFGTPLSADALEIDILRPSGPVVAELRVMETEWEGEPARLVSLRDVTDRKRAEERERNLYREQVARSAAEERAARESFLSQASRRLAGSLALETTLESVAQLVVEELADACVLDVAVGGRSRRVTAARTAPGRERLARAADGLPPASAEDPEARRGELGREPVLVPDLREERPRDSAREEDRRARHAELIRVARALGARSLLVVPLQSGHGAVGQLAVLATGDSPRLGERELYLASELGRRAGMAIENAWLYEQADAANRAKSNFLSVISHELRTPLSAILGYTDLMDRAVPGGVTEKYAHFLTRIRASSNHLLQIIEEILAFASAESGEAKVQRERITMDELMDGLLAVADPLAHDSGLDFRVTIDDPEAVLETDARKVRQILLNLISNALKFTPEGAVRVHATVAGPDAVFRVEDTGIGIPRDRLANIFEWFWQLEDPMTRRAGGTGLGLAVAQNFASLLCGAIHVDSVEGAGSVFTLRIPATLPAATDAPPVPPATDASPVPPASTA